MSNSISAVLKSTFSALLNGDKVKVNYTAFLVNANAFGTESPDDKVKARALQRVESKKEKVSQYISDVTYIIGTWDKLNMEYAPVYMASEKLANELEGVFDEYQEDELEKAGTLLKVGGRWVIESNLETIESIRRQKECLLMDAGKCSIGGISNAKEYLAHLATVDTERGAMRTRGHGIS